MLCCAAPSSAGDGELLLPPDTATSVTKRCASSFATDAIGMSPIPAGPEAAPEAVSSLVESSSSPLGADASDAELSLGSRDARASECVTWETPSPSTLSRGGGKWMSDPCSRTVSAAKGDGATAGESPATVEADDAWGGGAKGAPVSGG